ncbi:M48 family metalloprotease [Plantactinospora soyae]|uniref:Zn-dependent protease with chaperone function n=1 Tax=Plantactinospora soyae TaxID=1544732 RepID=A0A927M6J5_9ACTN|nr:M48 family metalloprotease [Plantactinospora soyae]MBE1487661.1 Zn-dependent protease with chaperone function [Plantactinospora soyae]
MSSRRLVGASLRASTDIRFVMLVAAVLASSVVAFGAVYIASPAAERVNRVQGLCLAGMLEAVAPMPVEDATGRATALMRDCVRPFFHEQAIWVVTGILVEMVVAGLLYLLHPWWLARRRRMRRLAGDEHTDMLDELDELARQAGLRRPPRWLVAPYSMAHGGQAFGLPGDRRVCLDVGLLVRYDLDRAGFRAVVRHELAHLRNRDVDRTYLSIATWWSFVAVAVAPFVVLSLNPDLWRRRAASGSAGSPADLAYPLVALAALTVVVYLARNAILRAREVHADTTAAAWDIPDGALSRVIGGLPWPPSRSRWVRWTPRWDRLTSRFGSHPSPAQRAAAIVDPRRLLHTGIGETASYGIILGLTLYNVSIFVGNLLEAYLMVGLVLLALAIGVLLLGLLVRAVRHADSSTTTEPPWTRRRVLLLPVVAALGVAVSGPLSLTAAENVGLDGTGLLGLNLIPLSALLLTAGFLLFVAWVRSADAALAVRPTRPGRRRWRQRLVAATAIAAGAPLFGIWYQASFGGSIVGFNRWGQLTQTGWAIDWYARLADWTGISYLPRLYLGETPIPVAGPVLLWVVPAVLLGWCRRGGERPPGVRQALVTGAVAGLGVIALGLAMPYAARAALPPEVRHTPDGFDVDTLTLGTPLYFFQVYYHTYLVVAVLAQAVAAAVIAARSTRLRPILTPLAVTITVVLATLGYYLNRGVSECLHLIRPGTRSCEPVFFLPDRFVLDHLAMIASWGLLVAVPAALLGAATGALWRRRRAQAVPAAETATVAPPGVRPGRGLAAVGLAALAVLALAGAATALPGNYHFWKPNPPPAGITEPTVPATSIAVVDPCLIGTWQEVSRKFDLNLFGRSHRFAGSGISQTFQPDGTVVLDYGSGTNATTTIDGQRVDLVWSGRATARYRLADGTIRYDYVRRQESTMALRIDGVERMDIDPSTSWSADHYVCSSEALTQTPADPESDGWYRIELRRTGPGG